MTTAFTQTQDTISISATTSSTTPTSLGTTSAPIGRDVRVHNAGTGLAFISFGASTLTAAVTGTPIPSGAIEVHTIGPGVTHAGAITGTGTATVYFTPGQGE